MAARYEITKKYAKAYATAPKKGQSQILDQVVEITGWNRDHARQQLVARLNLDPPMVLGGSDGECSCGKQGWDCLRFTSAA